MRVAVRFAGRQLGHKEFGYEILKKITGALAGTAQIEGEPKWMGRELVLVLAPAKGEKDAKVENQEIGNTKI